MASNLRVDSIVPATGANVSIGTATGGVNIPGVLTYEDVTNVDSVGVITGRSNINCTSGRFQRGSATVQDGDAIAGGININGTDMDASVIMSVFGNDGDFTRISGSKSRNASVGSHTIVQNNDVLLSLKGFGSDGTNFEEAAQIEMQVDGSPGNDDMPGRIVFKTTADGASSPTERLRIGSAGQIGIAGANYGTSGQVLTSAGSGSAVQWATPAVTGGNMFLAKMNGGYNTTNNTDGEIIFQAESFDLGSAYNHTNGRFTPNIAGYYFIDASLQFSTNSANNLFESTIWKNGTEQFKNRMWNDGANSELHCKVSGIVSVNGSSDYISIAAWQNSGGNLTVNPGNGSYFTGFFLRSL